MTKNMTKTLLKNKIMQKSIIYSPLFGSKPLCFYIFHGFQREMLLKNIQIQKSLLILFLHAENNSTNKDTMETCRTVTSS